VDGEALIAEISDYCRHNGLAETTFGRLAVNDGKLVSRLRTGGRVTGETLTRLRAFMSATHAPSRTRSLPAAPRAAMPAPSSEPRDAQGNFRFYDNRQKYLLFVTTCSEKWVVADRIGAELANIHPRPPSVRLFDAGVGDGTVLSRVMRAMHDRFPTMPLYIVAKEISLEDVRLTLEKMPDRFFEHPSTVLVMTNMHYSEAPWLTPHSVEAATSMVWREVALTGHTGHDFEQQITELQPFLAQNWGTRIRPKTGGLTYEKPVVLVIYRDDYRFLLDSVMPRRGAVRADYDLVIASQPYRARAGVEFKAIRVIAPLVRALGPGGRLLGMHSHGGDPGLEIIQKVWPGENPFVTDRHQLLAAVKTALGKEARNIGFHAGSDARSLFRYDMHTLPNEVSASIGTSTLLAAWNAAIYVAQIEDQRLADVMSNNLYLEATREVLQKHGGLWFWDESYVITRRRDLG
jgi:hypothetical protein